MRRFLGMLLIVPLTSTFSSVFGDPVPVVSSDTSQLEDGLAPIESLYLRVNGTAGMGHDDVQRITLNAVREWGVEIVDTAKDADAILEIGVSHQALSASYKARKGFVRRVSKSYTGAEVAGNVDLSVSAKILFSRSFKGVVPTTDLIREGSYDDPSEAPYREALWRSDLEEHLLTLTAFRTDLRTYILATAGIREVSESDVFLEDVIRDKAASEQRPTEVLTQLLLSERPEVVIVTLAAVPIVVHQTNTEDAPIVSGVVEVLKYGSKYKRFKARIEAARVLGEIGDEAAVEPLIATADDAYEDTASTSIASLRKITGEDFGSDAGRWKDWWEKKTGRTVQGYTNPDERKTFWFWIFIGVMVIVLWLLNRD